VNGYLRLWLTCCCWRLYLCRSQEWPEHSPSPSGFVYLEFSWAWLPLLQAFPFPSTLGEVIVHQLSQACVFIYSSCGKWVFPLSCGVFLPPPLLQAFPLLVTGLVPPLLPSPAGLLWGISPPRSLALRVPRPLCYVSFLLLLLIIQGFFSLFSLGGGRSVQGAMLIWPRVVCGSTACRLAHLVVCSFPSRLGAAVWRRHGSPPGFSV
jgi:hypothetical protein